MPRGASAADTVTIVYPPGCREVTEDLGPDELIRRLKTLAHTFQSMGQDEGAYQEYIPLSLHLADDYFLLHASRDVQLLIACCIADVLRVYAPEAPYKDPEQVKTIFMFLIKQLGGLKDPKDPAFKRYFYLLENLAYVKSFNMCFELEDCQDIFCALFTLMFKIINDEHSGKVKSFMLDVLCPLITESDVVSNELLDIVLMNIVEPAKSQRKNSYLLAKELVVKCSDTLEPYIQAFFNHVLILGKEEKRLNISKKVYDLIYELNHICPSVLLAVLPQLEFKLKSTDEHERMGSVSLLARMFSEKGSTLAVHHRPLWVAFLGRFNDISVSIRTKCVQYSMHFLLNHPELRTDVTETLQLRQHDSEESVRYEVVMAIVTTAKKDFSIVSDSEDLLNFVKERTLDKKFKIRKEAMCGLAMIYKKHLNNPDVPQATKNAVMWIKDKILHGYYMTGMDDRLLVERLLNTCLVPYQLPADERMKKLYYLFGSIDENATKAFIELQKHQLAVRKNVAELIELHQRPQDEERDKEMIVRISHLAKFLPDPVKAQEFIKKLSSHLSQDESLLKLMETVVSVDVSCKDCADSVTQILKKLGQPVMTNLYYNTIKMLLERISSVMIDREALQILVGYVEECLKGGELAQEIGLTAEVAGERGLRLLFVLSFVFPSHFLHEDILSHLLSFLSMEDETVAPLVLSVLTFVGKHKPVGDEFPDVATLLTPICQKFAEAGTPKQAKHAIRCLFVNSTQNQDMVFTEILEKLKENLVIGSPYYRTAIVSLGHIAFNLPDKFPIQIKNIVSRKIVKELLMKDNSGEQKVPNYDGWCEEHELSEEARCKIEGMKMMSRWLLGLKTDVISAQKTFRMLNAFIVHKGDLLEEGRLSKAEMAWLRLSAGCSMLKICEQKGVGDQFTAEQFYNLSILMNDEMPRVRENFSMKLHKGLGRGIPQKCLPLDFMGFYALVGQEPDKRLKMMIKQFMIADINKRRDYIKTLLMTGGSDKAADQLPHIMPDYMLVFAVPILSHDPDFVQYDDTEYLIKIRNCLWFVLEPLMMKNDSYCFGFYKALIERMKNHKDAVRGEDDIMNYKLWAVCDLAMGLIMSKTTNFEMKEFPSEPRIPPMYFKRHEDALFVNTKTYLPTELHYTPPKKSGITIAVVGVEKGTKKKGRTSKSELEKDVGVVQDQLDAEEPEKVHAVTKTNEEQGISTSVPVGTSTPMPTHSRTTRKGTQMVEELKSNNTQTSVSIEQKDAGTRRSARQTKHQGESSSSSSQESEINIRMKKRKGKEVLEVVPEVNASSAQFSQPRIESSDADKRVGESISEESGSSDTGSVPSKRSRIDPSQPVQEDLKNKLKSNLTKLTGSETTVRQGRSATKEGNSENLKQKMKGNLTKITRYFAKKNEAGSSSEQEIGASSSERESSKKYEESDSSSAPTRHSARRMASKSEQSSKKEETSSDSEPLKDRKRGRPPKSVTVNTEKENEENDKSQPTRTSSRRGMPMTNGNEKDEESKENKRKLKKDEHPPSPTSARKSRRLGSSQDSDDSGPTRRRARPRK